MVIVGGGYAGKICIFIIFSEFLLIYWQFVFYFYLPSMKHHNFHQLLKSYNFLKLNNFWYLKTLQLLLAFWNPTISVGGFKIMHFLLTIWNFKNFNFVLKPYNFYWRFETLQFSSKV